MCRVVIQLPDSYRVGSDQDCRCDEHHLEGVTTISKQSIPFVCRPLFLGNKMVLRTDICPDVIRDDFVLPYDVISNCSVRQTK